MPLKPIALALREAKRSVFLIVLCNSLIDAVVMLMLLLLVCTLLTLPSWWAVVAAGVYLMVHTYGAVKDVNFTFIESKTPSLKEQLITVADNWREKNPIVESLNEEVLHKMREIRTSSFLDFGKLTREIAVMAIVSFIIIGSAAYNVEFIDMKRTINEIRDFKPLQEYTINEELLEYEESQNLSDILGDESITELGQQQLDLEINPLKSDVDIGNVDDPDRMSFKEVPPPAIKATADTSFEEQIPKQYQKIVKTYFKEITRS